MWPLKAMDAPAFTNLVLQSVRCAVGQFGGITLAAHGVALTAGGV